MKKRIYMLSALLVGLLSIVCFSKFKAEAAVVNDLTYSMKYAYDDMDDGWKYAFKIYLYKDKNNYSFNGYNMKYEELEGYYIPVIDNETNEILDKIKPVAITLSVSEIYSKEILSINEYFNEKQFIKPIQLSDLDKLNIKYFEKEYLVDLFNRAIVSDEHTEKGQYDQATLFNRVEVESTNKSIPGKYKLTYMLDYGQITNVNIEFVNENGEYLKYKTKLNSNEEALISELLKLETSLINTMNSKVDTKKRIQEYSDKVKMSITAEDTIISQTDIENLISAMVEKLES